MSGLSSAPDARSGLVGMANLRRGLICLAMALIAWPAATSRCAEVPNAVDAAVEALNKPMAVPPETIPPAPVPLVRPRLAYLAGGSTWNLSSEEFLCFYADFPKAILLRCPAQHLSSDAKFHYYKDFRTNLEWAFERAPEDNFFIERSIWIRHVGKTTWQQRTTEATLATPW